MNATTLYVTTCRLVLQANVDQTTYRDDVSRVMPYLRQLLACTVCGNLLVEPYTAAESTCQHHVCKNCLGGKKKIKPTCMQCSDYSVYKGNLLLRSLLQCYRQLCEVIKDASAFKQMSTSPIGNNLSELVTEGAEFHDEYKYNAQGISKVSRGMLPPIHSQPSTQSKPHTLGRNSRQDEERSFSKENGPSRLAVIYPKSSTKPERGDDHDATYETVKNPAFKKPVQRRSAKSKQPRVPKEGERRSTRGQEKKPKPKYGCRCGNATSAPGKLTCCGQRCPCYVVSKACLDCRCRGCRNPHTKEGQKVLRELSPLKPFVLEDNFDSDGELLQLPDFEGLGLDQDLELGSDASPELDLL